MPRKILLIVVFALVIPIGEAAFAAADLAKLKDELVKVFGVKPGKIRPAPVSGLYEIEVGAQVVYATEDGKYLFVGDLVDIKANRNLTETRRAAIVKGLIDGVDEKDMIVIGPDNPKRTITVFTDVDCPYCAKLHRDVPELNKGGVKVRYLLFPRTGVGSESYRRSVAVWCAEDRVEAIGVAKFGGKLEMKTCTNPVADHYRLGQQIDVNGTPTILLDDGRRIGGYVPAAKLLAILGIAKPKVGALKP